jgi:putative transferase (TIGR04331 family)
MWTKEFQGVRIDEGVSNINSLRRKSKLIICTTLGTSEIEQFARSIPTVLRIDPVVHALRDSSVDIFREMESVGIVHWSTESLTKFLHENFEDIERWWSSDNVQTVINEYLSRFGFQSTRPIRDVLSALNDTDD